jgi:hypothetical protein
MVGKDSSEVDDNFNIICCITSGILSQPFALLGDPSSSNRPVFDVLFDSFLRESVILFHRSVWACKWVLLDRIWSATGCSCAKLLRCKVVLHFWLVSDLSVLKATGGIRFLEAAHKNSITGHRIVHALTFSEVLSYSLNASMRSSSNGSISRESRLRMVVSTRGGITITFRERNLVELFSGAVRDMMLSMLLAFFNWAPFWNASFKRLEQRVGV